MLKIAIIAFLMGSLIIGSSYYQAHKRRKELERRKKEVAK